MKEKHWHEIPSLNGMALLTIIACVRRELASIVLISSLVSFLNRESSATSTLGFIRQPKGRTAKRPLWSVCSEPSWTSSLFEDGEMIEMPWRLATLRFSSPAHSRHTWHFTTAWIFGTQLPNGRCNVHRYKIGNAALLGFTGSNR